MRVIEFIFSSFWIWIGFVCILTYCLQFLRLLVMYSLKSKSKYIEDNIRLENENEELKETIETLRDKLNKL